MQFILLSALGSAGLALLAWRWYSRRLGSFRRIPRVFRGREEPLRHVLNGSGDEHWDWDLQSGTVSRFSIHQLIIAASDERTLAENWRRGTHPEDVPRIEQRLAHHVEGRSEFFESEHRIVNDDGESNWVHSLGKIVERDEAGRPLRICGTTRKLMAPRQLEREHQILTEVINGMTEPVYVTNLKFHFVSVNLAFTKMTGYSQADVLGKPTSQLYPALYPTKIYEATCAEVARNGGWQGELRQKRKDGEEFLCWLQIRTMHDSIGAPINYVTVMNDVTDRKRAEQELRYLANYDRLTGLPNRNLLIERLSQAVMRSRRSGNKIAILFIDLDRFKQVNDSVGHAAGDRVLKATGARLRASVRQSDTVARYGGDEFTILLEDLRDNAEAELVAQKLMAVFSEALELDTGQEVVITPSIGISFYPDHGQVPSDLLQSADTAMYQSKEFGRNTYMVYTAAMDSAVRERANTVAALRKAIDRKELSVVYQPKMALHTNRITGVEALLRWHSEELGEVPPAHFIPLAEEIGVIVEIGEFVIEAACAQLKRWHDQGQRDLVVAINMSVLQLSRGELPGRLRAILLAHDVEAGHLELELTESMVMANAEQSLRTLTELKAIGVSLAIDDFGTGYSSLSYLNRLPIDTLKIDRSFVGDITTDPDDEAITATIITLAHLLGLNVIAEGVETIGQLEYLRGQGCDEIQGHWLSQPLSADACYAFIRQFEYSPSGAALTGAKS